MRLVGVRVRRSTTKPTSHSSVSFVLSPSRPSIDPTLALRRTPRQCPLPHRPLAGQRVRCSARDCSLRCAIVMWRTRLVPTHAVTTLWYSVYQVKTHIVRQCILLVILARTRSIGYTPRIRMIGVRFGQIEMLVGIIRLISSCTTGYASDCSSVIQAGIHNVW